MSQHKTAKELKKRLASAGFEVFRTVGEQVHLADRVRDNLIMDSGVAAVADPPAVRLVTRAGRSAFAGESEEALFARARSLAASALARGYVEVDRSVARVEDPGGGGATLETWYEVTFEKPVQEAEELEAELRFALGLEKAAGAG